MTAHSTSFVLTEKVIVVTGGAGLLGRHFCRAVAGHGGIAVVADVDAARAEEVAGGIRAAGGKAEGAALDITDTSSIDGLIADLDRRHGRIDAVVNNAYPRNTQWGRKLEDVTYADFCENVDRHLGGYFLIAQRFALHFRSHGGGNIVNMASVYGVMAPRFDLYAGTAMTMPVEYAAIKAAVIHLTRYFAQYFKQDGLRCNCLSPGGVRDGQPDAFIEAYNRQCGVQGMLQPDDVTGPLVFLLSDASKHITGQNLIVDDGFAL